MSEIVKKEQFSELAVNAGQVLEQNQLSISRATQVGNGLLDVIETEGMNPDIDAKCNTYLVRLRKTLTDLQDRRKPITQVMDAIKKEFTTLENQIDPKNADSIYFKIQRNRDIFAKDQAEKARKEAEAKARELAIQNERAEITAHIKTEIDKYFNVKLVTAQNYLGNHFNRMTLETFEKDSNYLKDYPVHFDQNTFASFLAPVGRYVDLVESESIKNAIVAEKLPEYTRQFEVHISEYKQTLVDRLKSRLNELKLIANANAEEAARLRAEAEERERAEKQRIAEEAAKRQAEEEAKAKAEKEAETLQNMFNAAQVSDTQAAQVRSGFNIVVLHPAGYVQIANFYFQNEGLSQPIDALERKTLGQMKMFCEKHALKTGELIESKYLKYEESYRAVAKAVIN